MNQTIPKVAIVGKPNVGKSTIFNRIIKKRKAIVDPTPGVTRDRSYETVEIEGRSFILIDTGGISDDSTDNFINDIRLQAEIAIVEADLILFVVEVTELSKDDLLISEILRKSGKKSILIVNKVDNSKRENDIFKFYELGYDDLISISAEQNINFDLLIEKIFENIPFYDKTIISENRIKIAIIGKPNTGKSSLLNIMVGKDRSIVSEIPGTTRDAVSEIVKYKEFEFEFIDTAGIRRKNKVEEDLEFYSVNRAIKSVEEADVVLLLIDSVDNISNQDKKITGIAMNRGKPMILVINKWDLLEQSKTLKKDYKDWIMFRFGVSSYIPIVNISCKDNTGITALKKEIQSVYTNSIMRIETNLLNAIIKKSVQKYPAKGEGAKLRIYYATQVSSTPPKIILFVNNEKYLTENYKKYLINQLRNEYKFEGVPIYIYPKKRQSQNEDRGKKNDKKNTKTKSKTISKKSK